MILLGILLLIIYIFVRHPALWIGAAFLIGLGALLALFNATGHPVCGGTYGCY
ncbi:hypothetical protein [Mycobacterium sp. TY813]|uniref:hypothetical protein n=1 Tax=Mycobacterium TaxID=1763 RepID=UPI002741B8A0|nr:hypothetical protein [Mycobacterium sp. TY813]MDP7729508.1 hypothetical protein [Mycobacterium sp. TY813]